jgi:hypothetical protein
MPTNQKATDRSATSMQLRTNIVFTRFGIFGSFFATTWFVFANQIHFPISKSNSLVWAYREIIQEKMIKIQKLPLFP